MSIKEEVKTIIEQEVNFKSRKITKFIAPGPQWFCGRENSSGKIFHTRKHPKKSCPGLYHGQDPNEAFEALEKNLEFIACPIDPTVAIPVGKDHIRNVWKYLEKYHVEEYENLKGQIPEGSHMSYLYVYPDGYSVTPKYPRQEGTSRPKPYKSEGREDSKIASMENSLKQKRLEAKLLEAQMEELKLMKEIDTMTQKSKLNKLRSNHHNDSQVKIIHKAPKKSSELKVKREETVFKIEGKPIGKKQGPPKRINPLAKPVSDTSYDGDSDAWVSEEETEA